MSDGPDFFNDAFQRGAERRMKGICPKCGARMEPDEICLQCLMNDLVHDTYRYSGMGSTRTGPTPEDLKRARQEANSFYDAHSFGGFGEFYKATATQQNARQESAQRGERSAEEAAKSWWRDELKKQAEAFKRSQQAAPPPAPAQAPRPSSRTVTVTLDDEMLRRLVFLCHPDKHSESKPSQIASRFLNELRARLDRA
jgi:hypothetical protein